MMDKKKKIILISAIAGCAVLLGVIAALIFSSLGTSKQFRDTKSPTAEDPSAILDPATAEPEDPAATEEPNNVIGAMTPVPTEGIIIEYTPVIIS